VNIIVKQAMTISTSSPIHHSQSSYHRALYYPHNQKVLSDS